MVGEPDKCRLPHLFWSGNQSALISVKEAGMPGILNRTFVWRMASLGLFVLHLDRRAASCV
jgi:hypothetical protein